MPNTIANERNLSFRKANGPRPGRGFTPHMVFNESWSSPNTPDAPKRRVPIPIRVAAIPVSGRRPAVSIMLCRATPPSSPISPFTWLTI